MNFLFEHDAGGRAEGVGLAGGAGVRPRFALIVKFGHADVQAVRVNLGGGELVGHMRLDLKSRPQPRIARQFVA